MHHRRYLPFSGDSDVPRILVINYVQHVNDAMLVWRICNICYKYMDSMVLLATHSDNVQDNDGMTYLHCTGSILCRPPEWVQVLGIPLTTAEHPANWALLGRVRPMHTIAGDCGSSTQVKRLSWKVILLAFLLHVAKTA